MYRFERFSREHLREALVPPDGGAPGATLPRFDIQAVAGGRLRNAQFTGRPLLVTFASLTDPISASAAPLLRALHREFRSHVAFLTVYVREAHPGDRIRQPKTFDWKLQHAHILHERDGFEWPLGVDDLEGTFHRAMGGARSSAHLVDAEGRVMFRALFSNDVEALRQALEAVRRGAVGEAESARRFVPALRGLAHFDDVVRPAGERAIADLRREAPLLYVAAEVAWMWRTLTPGARLVVAASSAALAALVIGGVGLARRRAA